MNKKTRIASLLKRYQFVDLSIAVSTPLVDREEYLRRYVERSGGPFPTYEPFRACSDGIYGVSLGLDPSHPPIWPQVEAAVRRACKGKDEDMNLDASKALWGLLREGEESSAYFHPERSLLLGKDRNCSFRLQRYLVRGEELVFQFPYPRRSRLSEPELWTMMSLIHFAYCRDDYAMAAVEIADLSAAEPSYWSDGQRIRAPRNPRLVQMPSEGPMPRDHLQSEIQDVYRILMKLSEE